MIKKDGFRGVEFDLLKLFDGIGNGKVDENDQEGLLSRCLSLNF